MDNNDSNTSKILYIAQDGGESHIASTDVIVDDSVSGGAPTSATDSTTSSDEIIVEGGAEDVSADSVSADSVSADSVSADSVSGGAPTSAADSVSIEEETEFMSGGEDVVDLPKDLMPSYYMDGGKNTEKDICSDDESSLCSDDIYAIDPICARLKRFLESKNNEPMIDILTDIRDQLICLNEKFNNKKKE